MLELKKVFHYYDKAKALEEVNLKVEKGSLHAVIGPNGAGKTTLLRAISGLEKIDRGSILFMDKQINGIDAHVIARMGIAHCPERRRLFPDMSVMENLALGGYSIRNKDRFPVLLEKVFQLFPRLEERVKQRSGTLSGGEQQMLAIARALVADPDLLLLDEPSTGLSPRVKREIFDAILQVKQDGKTILLVEQDAALAMEVADYIHVLEEGKIEMRGTRAELEREPRIKEVYLGIK